MKRDFVQRVANWGNFPVVEKEIQNLDTVEAIRHFVLSRREVVARGNGRCYGDASLGEHMISTKKLNKFISFDRVNGILECESGVLLSQILDLVLPQGYFLYVTPGTKFVTVGGAIASDVHGKNHHAEGCFSEFVLGFRMMNEKGDIMECSREENSELFWATIGGMGLTGIILSAKIRLRRIETAYIRQESIRARNLDEIFDLFEQSEGWTYNVAWIDCLQKGSDLGRSVLMRGEHAAFDELPPALREKALKIKAKKQIAVPFFLPGFLLNSKTVQLFNYFYFKKQRAQVQRSFVAYEQFFYPLDILAGWNKIYGSKGFVQYQMVIPKAQGREGMRRILEAIAQSGNGSFLAVLKLFGKHNPLAYNSFPMEGYTLALDFKLNAALPKLIDRLDAIVEEFGGKIYLTKDSMSRNSLTNYLKNVQNSKFVSLQHKRIINN